MSVLHRQHSQTVSLKSDDGMVEVLVSRGNLSLEGLEEVYLS